MATVTDRDRYARLLTAEAFRLTPEDLDVILDPCGHFVLVRRLAEEVRALWEDEAARDRALAGEDLFRVCEPPGKTGTIKVRLVKVPQEAPSYRSLMNMEYEVEPDDDSS